MNIKIKYLRIPSKNKVNTGNSLLHTKAFQVPLSKEKLGGAYNNNLHENAINVSLTIILATLTLTTS